MRSLAVINQKGGVGKTTTAVNLAAGLARFAGQSVLLLDLDPQAHASLHLGVEIDPASRTLYDVLTDGVPLAEAARPAAERLTIVPSHIDLVAAEVELAEHQERDRALAQALEPQRDEFDTLVVDCPPSLGLLTVNALAAVEEILIPLQAHFFSLQGLGRLLETVALVRERLNPRLGVKGIVLCMYEQTTRLAQEVSDEIRRFLGQAGPEDVWYGARLFETRIRRNIKLAESPSFGKSIFDYDPSSNGAADYEALVCELLGERPARSEQTPVATEERVVKSASAPAENVVSGAEAQDRPSQHPERGKETVHATEHEVADADSAAYHEPT